jgi:hypothetical protein
VVVGGDVTARHCDCWVSGGSNVCVHDIASCNFLSSQHTHYEITRFRNEELAISFCFHRISPARIYEVTLTNWDRLNASYATPTPADFIASL